MATPVPGRDKFRVQWPSEFEPRLRRSVEPNALLFLTRAHTAMRPLSVDEAVERCRSDFSAGKSEPTALAAAEADLRQQFAGIDIVEFGLSMDLDRNYASVAKLWLS